MIQGRSRERRVFVVAAIVSLFASILIRQSAIAVDRDLADIDYDIVYVRAPRHGDDVSTRWPEVKDPILMEAGADLVLLHPDGSEEVLVPGGDGAIVDPFVSFDGHSVYYARFHDLRESELNRRRRNAPRQGADIYRIDLRTRRIVRLTHQHWTPNTGAANWSSDPLRPSQPDTTYLGYGIFNLGPCPLPDGRVVFTSSRNGFLPNKSYTFPNLQLFVMDDDGGNVEQIGHLNLGSALHPTILTDGRVMFSSYESQGLRDQRVWGLWAIWPDGRNWEPLVSAFEPAGAFHFQTQMTDQRIVVTEYYNQNSNGFGTFVSLPPKPPTDRPPFGGPDSRHASNRRIQQGLESGGKPRWQSYSFQPAGLTGLTSFGHADDRAASRDSAGKFMGKVTHPAGAPKNNLLLVWTPGPAHDNHRPTNRPYYDGGIYLLKGGKPVDSPDEFILLKNDPRFNEMQPRPVVSYREIYGIDQPEIIPWLPNDGSEHESLAAGTPFGLIGSSSLIKRDTNPGSGDPRFEGLDPLNTSRSGGGSNWQIQGADAGRYTDEDIYAIRILAMEPTSHFSYGPYEGRNFASHSNERLRILGEIPVRKQAKDDRPILDADGNPDTSFLARIPADVPFTFQTLDQNGLVLNMSQTWHQVRPGEVRYDCGGCHAHAQIGTDFLETFASTSRYQIPDLTRTTPLIEMKQSGLPALKQYPTGAVDVEYYRDIKPILRRSCVKCHSEKNGNPPAGLVLDDERLVAGYENTYRRLANDPRARYGRKSMTRNGTWRLTNASRYVRKFQSRRSLLVWKVFGRRLDGWSNKDHPTESVPGDKTTFPSEANADHADIDFVGTIMPPPDSGVPSLSDREKQLFARWIDLGCPINREDDPERSERGWFLDDLRPTLTVSQPRAHQKSPLKMFRIGAFDYYSGLDPDSFSVTADFPVHGQAAGSELAPLLKLTNDHVWTLTLAEGDAVDRGTVEVSVSDHQGNQTTVVRRFVITKENE